MTGRAALWAEFLVLFVGAPLTIALFFPPREMFTALFAFTVVGVGLLWCLYPFISALPQELIFRPLFFHRYGGLFASVRHARLANAALFSLAHLMYWSWIVLALTFIGGWIFANVYLRRGFPAVWLLHGIAGNVLFTVGMGTYFWSGNVVQPF